MRYFWKLVSTLAILVLGLLLGVVLTFTTVIGPRSAELQRQRSSSTFLKSFSLIPLLEQTEPRYAWRVESRLLEAPYRISGQDPFVGGKFEFATAQVPFAEQDQFLANLQPRLVASVMAPAYINSNQSNQETTADKRKRSESLGYTAGDRMGVIHMEARGKGDDLTIVVVVQER
jgi:hypothetical protein